MNLPESTPVYLGTIGALAGALREIRDAHEAGTAAHDIAHKALDDADQPQRLAAAIRDTRAERDRYRQALEALAANADGSTLALRRMAREALNDNREERS